MSYDTVRYPKTVADGNTFLSHGSLTFTVLGSTDVVIEDSEGNVFGTYTAGKSYQGVMPSGVFKVTGGSVKVWG